ncbi:unnamed protein product [Oppiella nova]|uniref:dolichyl-phosphate beta-glucosyltransferase n=1 Tax=Oppiella nova TaxID=334625 RepID=A0A7R9LAD5_9ACAR|nr:unnamed protein product [Oppiella nova]CAG2161250.1 unnamed protein product [Oppiella nova]
MHLHCECWTQLLSLLLLTIVTVFVISCLVLRLLSTRIPVIRREESEHYFTDPKTKQRHRFPSLLSSDEPSVYLSVIVPAFNESQRLPKMLDETIDYLETRCRAKTTPFGDQLFAYEIIVVDDGSDDRTTHVAHDYSLKYGCERIRCLTLAYNRGKGGAVQLGVLCARGRLVLFADADGATRFADFQKLEDFVAKHRDSTRSALAIGSRAHLQSEAIATRSLFRTVLMHGFHFGVWLLTVRTVRDTQCGFKLFERSMARTLFQHIHCQKWAFDVELLLIAEKLGVNIGEIAVRWTEIEGSKVVPVWSWLQMGKDVALISLKYAIGAHIYPKHSDNN